MADFRYSNLRTIYSCKVGNYKRALSWDACYRCALSEMRSKMNEAEFTIVLANTENLARQHYRNYCMMTGHQINNYLRRIASIKPFKYKVYESNYYGAPCYKINLRINGTKKEITFVLQCIKRLYEWPYNYFLLHAYKLQSMPEYRFDSILNLFNVVFSTYYFNKNTDHSFSGNTKFEKYKTIREKLPYVNFVSEIYPDVGETVRGVIPKEISVYDRVPCWTEQWDDNLFEAMLPAYVYNYSKLKK